MCNQIAGILFGKQCTAEFASLPRVTRPVYVEVASSQVKYSHTKLELCADDLVVGGGVGWSYDRRRRRAAHFHL